MRLRHRIWCAHLDVLSRQKASSFYPSVIPRQLKPCSGLHGMLSGAPCRVGAPARTQQCVDPARGPVAPGPPLPLHLRQHNHQLQSGAKGGLGIDATKHSRRFMPALLSSGGFCSKAGQQAQRRLAQLAGHRHTEQLHLQERSLWRCYDCKVRRRGASRCEAPR